MRRRRSSGRRINLAESNSHRGRFRQSLHMSAESVQHIVSCSNRIGLLHKVDKSACLQSALFALRTNLLRQHSHALDRAIRREYLQK